VAHCRGSRLIAEREFSTSDLGRVVGLIIVINHAVFSFAPGVFGALPTWRAAIEGRLC